MKSVEIKANAVNEAGLTDGSVSTPELAADVVTSPKVAGVRSAPRASPCPSPGTRSGRGLRRRISAPNRLTRRYTPVFFCCPAFGATLAGQNFGGSFATAAFDGISFKPDE